MTTGSVPDKEAERAANALRARTALIEQFNSTGNLERALLHGPKTVLDLVPARAAALHLEGVTSTVGDSPEITRIEQMVEQMRVERPRLPIATASLSTELPQLAALLPEVEGLLIVPIDGARGVLAWFRPALESAADGKEAPRAEPWEGLDKAAALLSRDLDGAILRNLHSHLARFGFHDALTGLANSQLLVNRIAHALGGPTRGAGVVLLSIDINSFTAINDVVGHDRGDEVLIQVADRLRTVTRDSDTLARLGGGEFVILAGSADREVASRIAERVLPAFERPFTVTGGPVPLTVSIGGSEAEADDDPTAMLRRAHIAVEWAKDFGRTIQAAGDLLRPPLRAAFVTDGRVKPL